MTLDDDIEVCENESVAIRCRRLLAAVISQGYSYMVRAGLEYGEVYNGEATIFLRIPDDPSTVYYSLSAPKEDVGPSTGWSEHADQTNRLHLTAVGQVVAFTLRALQTPPRVMQNGGQKHRVSSRLELSWVGRLRRLLQTSMYHLLTIVLRLA
jgi:hypothetical protein